MTDRAITKVFDRPAASPLGMLTPYYVAAMRSTTEACTFWLHGGEQVDIDDTALTGIGADGAVDCTENTLFGDWTPMDWRCEQTGGMCMVDVIVFANGACVSITDECALLWPSVEAWGDGCGDGDEAALVCMN